jgi:hypothetical protein
VSRWPFSFGRCDCLSGRERHDPFTPRSDVRCVLDPGNSARGFPSRAVATINALPVSLRHHHHPPTKALRAARPVSLHRSLGLISTTPPASASIHSFFSIHSHSFPFLFGEHPQCPSSALRARSASPRPVRTQAIYANSPIMTLHTHIVIILLVTAINTALSTRVNYFQDFFCTPPLSSLLLTGPM